MKILMKKKLKNKFIKKIKQTKLIIYSSIFQENNIESIATKLCSCISEKNKNDEEESGSLSTKILKDFEQFLYIHTKTFNMEQKKKKKNI